MHTKFLGMPFELKNNKVIADVVEHMEEMLDEFPMKFDDDTRMRTPSRADSFNMDGGEKLDESKEGKFHRTVAKGSFASHRGRPDLKPVTAVS